MIKAAAVTGVALFILGWPLVADAQTPTSITLVPSTVCGKNPIAKVNLSGPAPAAGLVIQLSSSIPSVASVPASVTAASGATASPNFQVTCVQIAQSMAVNISATANGTTQSALINFVPPVLSGITVDPHKGDSSVTARATLTAPAPPGGQIVTLLRTGPIAVPQSVTVAAGAGSAAFTVVTQPVPQQMTATITGTAGVTKTVEFTLVPPPVTGLVLQSVSNFLSSVTTVGGRTVLARLTIGNIAPVGGLIVQLSSSNAAVGSVPATATVEQARSEAGFGVSTVPVAQTTAVTITASSSGVSKSAVVTVTAPRLNAFGLDPATLVGGQPSRGRVILTGPAPVGGTSVLLSSSETSRALVPPSVTIAAGADMADFNIATFPTGRRTDVTITASAGGATIPAVLTVGGQR